MFIQTETTPNPATLKFLPGKIVLQDGVEDFRDAETASARSPLAAKLFAIPSVSGVFFGFDFITVTKADGEWAHLKPAILGTIMEHMMADLPIMAISANQLNHDEEEFFAPQDQEIVDTIKELLETRVRPAVAQDGGDITFRGFEHGVVYLNMRGACSGCPSSTATLKHGIENLLRHFVPDVVGVEAMPQ
ncbi:NifU family protein [Bartonella sp. HY329]|uniref:NifU family protein n=1 Tax=unclassified Bartonella TaxID=2645622 RepID=UPI0015FD1CC6|nr:MULTISPECIES: NifU family protein [unclassified Bartonella]UXM96231.1 NifU family protein [Bartonella sp. HY329]UXN10555.1 NifU family protein [Bartonella sp. HY328]